jgi:hypothetical protein
VGVAWFLGWFELYLEIFRYHHVTPATLVHPASWLSDGGRGSRPGSWLELVLLCSSLAPPLFAVLRIASPRPPSRLEPRFPFAVAVAIFGALLCVLGTLNQVIRQPPLEIDLTLRAGNGGFVALGLLLLAATFLRACLRRRARER